MSGGNRSLGAVDVARPDGAPAISVGLPAGRIPHYYTSKYAGLDGLPRDLGYGRDERLEAVRKYIGYVFEPPDGLGDPVENAEHLRAACARLLVGRGTENAALLMLDAFSALATEPTPPESEVEAAVSPSLQVAVRQYRKAYRRFTHAVPWDELHPVLALFSGAVVDVNAGLDALSRGLYQEGLLYRTLVVLRDVNRTLST